jgi:hypothetical protein
MKRATVVLPVRGTATLEFEVDDTMTDEQAEEAAIERLAKTPRADIFEVEIDDDEVIGVCFDDAETPGSAVPG